MKSKFNHPFSLIGNILVNSLDVITPTLGFAALLHTFGSFDGWNFPEVALLLGMANLCMGMSLLVMGAFDSFLFVPIYRSGQFEAALLRPGSPIVFLAASNLRPYRFGRVIASVILICIALIWVGPARWNALAVIPVSIIVGSIMVSSLWLIDAAATMRLGQANDMTRNIPFVASEVAFFPQGLFPITARFVTQFVLGLGAATYLPMAYALGKEPNLGPWSLIVGPLLLPVTVLGTRSIWKLAIRRFEQEGAK